MTVLETSLLEPDAVSPAISNIHSNTQLSRKLTLSEPFTEAQAPCVETLAPQAENGSRLLR